MNIPNLTNNIGLIFDIIGVIILFKYGLPEKFNKRPRLLLEGDLSPKEQKENKIIIQWSYCGLIFLLSGFIFQLISNFL
jgi:hypothetical protein